jgi:radical SAM protein with 4Fe4S-binding SPASM domain
MNDKIFCNKPFSSIFLGPDGGIRPCCSLAGGDLGNLNKQPIEEILNGDLVKSIRQSFINNEWHPACSSCKKLEDIGPGLSEKNFIKSDYKKILKIGADYFKLKSIDLRWTNLCNLACNYCSPYFSSRWAQINNIKINSLQKDNISNFLKYIKNNLDGIESIMMLGGEPLLQKENHELLDIISTLENGISITMLTNLSNPIETNTIAQKLLNRSGKVNWCISIETVGDRFEYVRDGASWETLNNNIAILNKNRPNVSSIDLYPIYCLYSAFNLEEYFEWALSINADSIRWQMLFHPNELSILNLNKDLKLEAITNIDKIVEKYSTNFDMQSLLQIKNEISSFKKPKQILIHAWNKDLEKNKLPNKKFTFNELWPELATKLG